MVDSSWGTKNLNKIKGIDKLAIMKATDIIKTVEIN